MRIVDIKGKPVENPNYEPLLVRELGILVDRYIELYGFEFQDERLDVLCKETFEYVYSKHRELVIVAPLENFELKDIDQVLFNGCKIRKLLEWEVEQFIELGYPPGSTFAGWSGFIYNIYTVLKG